MNFPLILLIGYDLFFSVEKFSLFFRLNLLHDSYVLSIVSVVKS